MPRPLFAIALLAVALAAGACSASTAPGWTFAAPTPAPPVTPAPSGAASSPGTGSTAPAEPTPVPTDAGPSGATGGATVDVSAINVAYEQTEISAPAGAPFVIQFDNKDAGIPHNVEIKDASAMSMFKGEVITGVAKAQYQVPSLSAGTYQFVCSVHPNMTGTLKVGG